jgi:hypothetical protein
VNRGDRVILDHKQTQFLVRSESSDRSFTCYFSNASLDYCANRVFAIPLTNKCASVVALFFNDLRIFKDQLKKFNRLLMIGFGPGLSLCPNILIWL